MAKTSFAALLLFLFVPALAAAQTFTNVDFGYSIELDDSFEMTRNDNATYFISKDNGALVIIRNWPGLDEATAKDYLQQGYQDARIAVVPSGETEELSISDGKGFLVDIQGIIDRKLVKGIAGGFIGDKGQGMVVVVSGSDEDWEKLSGVARKTLASVKFVEFRAGPDAHDWYYMLAGTRLALRGTSNDRTKKEDIYFCSDGSFRHRIFSSAMRDFDSGSSFNVSGRTRTGEWTVVDEDGRSKLMLRYSNGREESAIIEDRNGQTFLDDQRYYMMRNNRCR